MPSPKGTILLTGSNGGLGSQIVSRLIADPTLASSIHGLYAVRDAEKAATLNKILHAAPPSHQYSVVPLDLGRLSSVRTLAADINAKVAAGEIPRIRALVLCAGYQEHTTQTFSEDGFDLSFQANYLSHWLLTMLLLGSMDLEAGRVVIVGSWTHDTADPRNKPQGFYSEEKWKTIFHNTESLARGTWSSPSEDPTYKAGFRRYGAGKLCETMMIHELQARLNSDPALHNISVLGVDPGGMPSAITRRGSFWFRVTVSQIRAPMLASLATWLRPNGPLRTTYKSAGDVLRAALDTLELGERPKDLYLNGTEVWPTGKEAQDPKRREMLWKDSVKYAGMKEGLTALANWR